MKRTGFTIIELMIVVAILGILIAIAVPAYNDWVETRHKGNNWRTVCSVVSGSGMMAYHTVEFPEAFESNKVMFYQFDDKAVPVTWCEHPEEIK